VTGFDNIEHATLSDVGVRRSHNQDNHAVLLATDAEKWQSQGHLFLVADGMGAHAVGEKASELAANIIPHIYHKHAHQGAVPALRKAFIEANATIHARGQQNREFEGMGTTGTALLLRPEGAWIGHVGDSRAYRVRDGQIEQLSFDHSLVWEYARQQRINPDRVQNIPTNVIVRSLGPEPLVRVDIEGPHPLRDGDTFVLCSDGLSGQLTDHELGAVVSVLPPAEACRFLVDLANLRGGPDNITVVVIRVGGKPLADGKGTPLLAGRGTGFRIPWPLTALALGALLAGGAVGAMAAQMYFLGIPAFLVAAVVIVAGLVGLVFLHRKEQLQAAEEGEHSPPHVYRQAPCRIERGLLDKLARATAALKQRAEEKKWDPDWTAYQRHNDLAQKAVADNDLDGAFREYCRAMRALTEALERHRNKEEVFTPVWDKSG
jgi:protein phosphatase